MSALLSIIVPAYQAETTIERAVNSALKFEGNDLEVIVIDDGSTDGTAKILEKISIDDSRLRVVHQHNRGRCAARNKGVELACGQWLMFLDADDCLLPETFAALREACKNSSAPLVVFSNQRGGRVAKRPGCDNTSPSSAFQRGYPARVYAQSLVEEPVPSFLENASIYHCSAVWSRIYRRELVIRLSDETHGLLTPFPTGVRFSEDRIFNIAYLKTLGDRVIEFNPLPLYFWDREKSATCGVLHDDDASLMCNYFDLVKAMTDGALLTRWEQDCIVAREAMWQLQEVARLATVSDKTILDDYAQALKRPDVKRAFSCVPYSVYAKDNHWAFASFLVGRGLGGFALQFSIFMLKAKRLLAPFRA